MCASRHPSARGLPSAARLRKFLPAVGCALLPAVGFALFFLGPWFPSLAVFPLSCLHCPVRGTGARDPANTTHVCEGLFPRASRPFSFTHRVVLNLGFTLIILHVVLGYFHRTPGAVSPHALCCLLIPSRFLWSLGARHARPLTAFTCCAWSGGLQHHPSSPFRVLRV